MTVFLSGGAKSGKSHLAQDIAVHLAASAPHYYVATLRPGGREDEVRIKNHLADRAGLGFCTLERFESLDGALPADAAQATFLVDSVTSLLQNALFPPQRGYALDEEAGACCIASLPAFAARVRHAVFVSDNLFCDADTYSATTEAYRRQLAAADRRLAAFCDVVIEVVAGQPIFYKGRLPL